MSSPSDEPRGATLQQRADALKAVTFRPTTDGFIYRAPNPWIFGRADHYLVSADQRDAITDILAQQSTAPSPASRLTKLLGFSFVTFIIMLLVTSLMLLYSRQYPSLTIPGIAAATAIVPLLALTLMILSRLSKLQLSMLDPILANTPKTNERITNHDILWASRTTGGKISSRRQWIISGLINAFASLVFFFYALVSWHTDEGAFSQLQSLFIGAAACFFVFRAVFNFFCSQRDHLPDSARRVEIISGRILAGGTICFVGTALIYFGLMISGVVKPDLAANRARYERTALAGDAEAMTLLAGMYRDGRGGPQDYAKSREWYEKAAAAGDAAAMFWVGWLRHQGLPGASQDYATAHEWFLKAADRGNGAAMSWLGSDSQFGLGVTKDYLKAREWYEKAAAAGNSSAMNNLGTLYQNGWGVPQDYLKAREWYAKAATIGSTASMNALGVLYVNGWGVPTDLTKARAWYQKAAAGNHLEGMQHLAIMLDKGEGGPSEYQRAAHLLLQSAKLGHPWSKTVLDGPMLMFSPTTRTEIKRELAQLGDYRGAIDGNWNADARAAVTSYLKVPS